MSLKITEKGQVPGTETGTWVSQWKLNQMTHNVEAMSLTFKEAGVYSYGIHDDLYKAPTAIIFYLLYDTESIFSTTY